MLRTYKLVVLGPGGVGKSAITVRFIHDSFVEKYDPTVEDQYTKTWTVDGTLCTCEILDTAGTEQFLALHSLYMKSGDGFLLVFDLTNLNTLSELSPIREQILRVKEADSPLSSSGSSSKVPLVLVGNKCDLSYQRQVAREVAVSLATNWKSPYYETSARQGIFIDEIFEDVVRQIRYSAMNGPNGASGRPKSRNRLRKCSIL